MMPKGTALQDASGSAELPYCTINRKKSGVSFNYPPSRFLNSQEKKRNKTTSCYLTNYLQKQETNTIAWNDYRPSFEQIPANYWSVSPLNEKTWQCVASLMRRRLSLNRLNSSVNGSKLWRVELVSCTALVKRHQQPSPSFCWESMSTRFSWEKSTFMADFRWDGTSGSYPGR